MGHWLRTLRDVHAWGALPLTPTHLSLLPNIFVDIASYRTESTRDVVVKRAACLPFARPQVPFEARSFAELAMKILNRKPRTIQKCYSVDLRQLVRGMLKVRAGCASGLQRDRGRGREGWREREIARTGSGSVRGFGSVRVLASGDTFDPRCYCRKIPRKGRQWRR